MTKHGRMFRLTVSLLVVHVTCAQTEARQRHSGMVENAQASTPKIDPARRPAVSERVSVTAGGSGVADDLDDRSKRKMANA